MDITMSEPIIKPIMTGHLEFVSFMSRQDAKRPRDATAMTYLQYVLAMQPSHDEKVFLTSMAVPMTS
jgi:hypothetical protein